jgi:hypothetical protein
LFLGCADPPSKRRRMAMKENILVPLDLVAQRSVPVRCRLMLDSLSFLWPGYTY